MPPEDLIRAYQEHKPDAIGLSGLLVKSAQQMVTTAGDFSDAGIRRAAAGRRRGAFGKIHPLENRAAVQVAVCYAKDAMTGLRLMNEMMDPARRESRVCRSTPSATPPLPKKPHPKPVAAAGERPQPRKFARTFPFPRLPISTAKSAPFRT